MTNEDTDRIRRYHLADYWGGADFLKLLAGETVALLGLQVTLLAVPLTAVTVLDATATEMGLLTAAQTTPGLLFGLLVGVWIDRIRRRQVLIAATLVRTVLLSSIPLAALFGVLHLPQMYLVAFLSGLCSVFLIIAFQSYLPTLVSQNHLIGANSKIRASEAITQIVGPSVGGGTIQLITAPFALIVDIIASLAAILCFIFIRTHEPAPVGETKHIWLEVGVGVQRVWHQPWLRALVGVTVATTIFEYMVVALHLLYITRDLGISPGLLGLILASGGPIALLGAVLTNRIIRHLGTGPTLVVALIVGGIAILVLPFSATQTFLTIPLLLIWRVLSSLADTIYAITLYTLLQVTTPSQMLGRVNATLRVCIWGAMSLGSLVGGVIGGMIGLKAIFTIAASGFLLTALWLFRSPVGVLRELPKGQDGA